MPTPPWRFFVAVLALGLNLRTVFASLPPLLTHVRADLGLSAGVAGLLTTGPLLCFGGLAPVAASLVRRAPIERVLVATGLLTAAGAGIRGVGGVAGLFAGALLAGAAVALTQTLLPVLIRARHGASGSLTGAFSMAITAGSAIAAATTVPLEHALGGWRGALAFYALPGAFATLVWAFAAGGGTTVARSAPLALHRLRGSWSVALYFGLQSAMFYAGLTWIPTILQSHGYSESTAGELQALTNAVQFGPAFVVPLLAGRRRNQSGLLVALAAAGVVGYGGILLAPHAAAAWLVVLGLAQGGALGLALVLPLLRGADGAAVAALTAMALTVGYLIAACAPFLVGLVHDASGNWSVPLVLLVVVTAAEVPVGWRATRDWQVGSPS